MKKFNEFIFNYFTERHPEEMMKAITEWQSQQPPIECDVCLEMSNTCEPIRVCGIETIACEGCREEIFYVAT